MKRSYVNNLSSHNTNDTSFPDRLKALWSAKMKAKKQADYGSLNSIVQHRDEEQSKKGRDYSSGDSFVSSIKDVPNYEGRLKAK